MQTQSPRFCLVTTSFWKMLPCYTVKLLQGVLTTQRGYILVNPFPRTLLGHSHRYWEDCFLRKYVDSDWIKLSFLERDAFRKPREVYNVSASTERGFEQVLLSGISQWLYKGEIIIFRIPTAISSAVYACIDDAFAKVRGVRNWMQSVTPPNQALLHGAASCPTLPPFYFEIRSLCAA